MHLIRYRQPSHKYRHTEGIPLGAVPLAKTPQDEIICLDPQGVWTASTLEKVRTLNPVIQKLVLELAIDLAGGKAAHLAEDLGVSSRTVEAWRSAVHNLPIKHAHGIAMRHALLP